ncbi:hypothetical protein DPMN_016763 [Dreissena polymorpha]|uniref:Uncharacterized protein n=1 Tax=Dreissena polymorpha TaxID=45954 RepID=A0A9D4NBV8_DREPO|nr:hypothetical protein DPMN_016763 [Dreissena polymorpha]
MIPEDASRCSPGWFPGGANLDNGECAPEFAGGHQWFPKQQVDQGALSGRCFS